MRVGPRVDEGVYRLSVGEVQPDDLRSVPCSGTLDLIDDALARAGVVHCESDSCSCSGARRRDCVVASLGAVA